MKPIPLPSDRAVDVSRDESGVPHIVAATWQDALYGLGYAHGFDRGTQVLFARSIAGGQATEHIADRPELLETDRFFRRMGLHLHAAEELAQLTDEQRTQIACYCQGVNAGLQGLGRTWPMWAARFSIRPWDADSVLLIGNLLSFGGLAISQMQSERILLELIHSGVDEAALRELFAPRLDAVDFATLRRVNMCNKLSDEALELMTDLPRLAGSNAWAVHSSRSATGGALLAADPHLEINRLPAIWYEAVLQWGDGHYVMGATLPGCPLFAVARTRNVSWGVTYMRGDTFDYFIEDCRPGGTTGWQYRRGDRWLDFARRDEPIRRKNRPPETLGVYENEQGVLEADPEELGGGLLLSLAWSGRQGGGLTIGAWLDMIASADVRQASDTARHCPHPTLCWVFADAKGDIGQQCCGRFPHRGGGHNGLTPIPAWDEANHWRGWVDPDLLPRWFNPPQGFVATANEEINPPGSPMFVTQTAGDYRVRRITELLSSWPAATVSQMQDLQYDVVSVQARDLLQSWMPHLAPGPLRQALEKWDYGFSPQSREASLFMRLYRNAILEVLGHHQGIGWRRMVYLCTRAGYSLMLLTAADRLLMRDDSYWWQGRDKGELLRTAAAGVDVAHAPPWSEVNFFQFTDRFFGTHQVGRLLGYQSRRYSMPGCHATPFQGHVLHTATRESTFAPSFHFVTDMSQHAIWTNMPGGPSENRFSRLYRSDVARWMGGEYKKLTPRGEE